MTSHGFCGAETCLPSVPDMRQPAGAGVAADASPLDTLVLYMPRFLGKNPPVSACQVYQPAGAGIATAGA